MVVGIFVQKIFEIFFNEGYYIASEKHHWPLLRDVVKRVLYSDEFQKFKITYPPGSDIKSLVREIGKLAKDGLETFKHNCPFDKKRTFMSEIDLTCSYNGLKLRGIVDFIIENPDNTVWVYDGKANSRFTADKNQLYFYAFILRQLGVNLTQVGFIYWRYGWQPQPFSDKILSEFKNEVLDPVLPIFQILQSKSGALNLPAKPSKETCKFCGFRSICEDSFYRDRDDEDKSEVQEVLFQ